jgi:ADP-ribose pyrophosphatase
VVEAFGLNRAGEIEWEEMVATKRKSGKATKTAKQVKAAKTGKILGSEVIYEGPVFGLRRDEVLEPSGVRARREVITHPGSVVVLPVLPDGKIVMIRQYRHATRQYMWELVAGRKEPEETPEEGAARELLEETGYRAKRFKVFLDVFPTPGFLEERMFILLAEGLKAGKAEPEEDEKIEVKAYKTKKLEQMMKTGELKDAKSIAGILYYLTFLR